MIKPEHPNNATVLRHLTILDPYYKWSLCCVRVFVCVQCACCGVLWCVYVCVRARVCGCVMLCACNVVGVVYYGVCMCVCAHAYVCVLCCVCACVCVCVCICVFCYDMYEYMCLCAFVCVYL